MALTYMGTVGVLLRSVISTSNRFLISETRHFDGAPTTSDLPLTTDVNEMREPVRLVPTRDWCCDLQHQRTRCPVGPWTSLESAAVAWICHQFAI
jgi:hypothetical protein